MKSKLSRLVLLATTVLIVMSSCSKSNNRSTPGVRFTARAINTNSVVAGRIAGDFAARTTNGISFNWTEGILQLSKIEFEAERDDDDRSDDDRFDDDDEIELEISNPAAVNIFENNNLLGSLQLPAGKYEEIEIELETKRSNSRIPLVLKGTADNNGTVVNIELQINEDLEIECEEEDITISGINDFLARIQFDLQALTQNISSTDLNNASVNNNTILISRSSNNAIYSKVLNNIQRMCKVDFD